MGIGRLFTKNQNLLAVLIFLILIVFGLVIGLVLTNQNNTPSNNNEDNTSIDSTEQAEAYLNEAYDLSLYVLEGDTSYCDQIKEKLKMAEALSLNEDLQIVAENILATCEVVKFGPETTMTGETNE